MGLADFIAELRQDGYTEVVVGWKEPGHVDELHLHESAARGIVVTGSFSMSDQIGTFNEGDVYSIAQGDQHVDTVGPSGFLYVAGLRPVTDL